MSKIFDMISTGPESSGTDKPREPDNEASMGAQLEMSLDLPETPVDESPQKKKTPSRKPRARKPDPTRTIERLKAESESASLELQKATQELEKQRQLYEELKTASNDREEQLSATIERLSSGAKATAEELENTRKTEQQLLEQMETLQKRAEQNEEHALKKRIEQLTTESEATRQLLEQTQKELAEFREWQVDPESPTFKERENELLGLIEKLKKESGESTSALDKTQRELIMLKSEHDRLVGEAASREKQQSSHNQKLQKELADTLACLSETQRELERIRQKHSQPAVAGNKSDLDKATHTGWIEDKPVHPNGRSRMVIAIEIAALFLLVLTTTALIVRHSTGHVYSPPNESNTAGMLTDRQSGKSSEKRSPEQTSGRPTPVASGELSPGATASATTPGHDRKPDSATDGIPSLWPPVDMEGVMVTPTRNVCVIKFEKGLFETGADITSDGRHKLEEVGFTLAPHMKDLVLILEGHADGSDRTLDSDSSDYETGLARAQAVKTTLSTAGGIPTDSMIVRSAGARNPPFPDASSGPANANKTVVMKLIRKQQVLVQ